jgi:hypothetical protein
LEFGLRATNSMNGCTLPAGTTLHADRSSLSEKGRRDV